MSGNSVGWLEGAFSYTTVKVVKIYNWKLGLVHHSIQLLIVLYIVGYVAWRCGSERDCVRVCVTVCLILAPCTHTHAPSLCEDSCCLSRAAISLNRLVRDSTTTKR